jgi:uncharacterized protein (TIRG00374 family)
MAGLSDAAAPLQPVKPPLWVAGRRTISFSVAAVLAAVLLYYSLRGIEWGSVASTVANASRGLLVASAGMVTMTLFLRAIRWRILLNAEGSVAVSTAFWATVSGFFGNNLLPARAGELVRTFLISSRSGLGNAYVLATALSERVADTVVLMLISAVVLLALDNPPGWLAGAARPIAILGLAGALSIAVLPLFGSVALRVIARAPLPEAVRPRLGRAVEGGLQGLRAFHDLRRLSSFCALTVVIWSLDLLGTVISAAALGFSMPLAVAALLVAGLSVGSALPSTPGYIGIYQFVAVSVLTPFGFSRTDAIAYILVVQALFCLVIGFWGSLAILRYRWDDRSATERESCRD